MKKLRAVFFTALAIASAAFAQQAAAQQAAAQQAAAQEQKMAVGAGPEWNMNSGENFAGALALGFDCRLPTEAFAAGITVAVSYNFDKAAVLEPAAMLRYYFLGGFFAQMDIGVTVIMEDGETTPLFLGGVRAGYRLPLGKMFYVEPYGRFGYPFMFGIGALAGIRF